MSLVEYNIYTTGDMGDARMQHLTTSFNEVFEKVIKAGYFKKYFTSNPLGESFHSLMEHNGAVVGALTATPYEYSYNGEKKIFTYLGGLFIKLAYRKDALAMFKMYKNLKSLLVEKNIALMMAVPNENSFPYFKHALKWTHVGNLPWYTLPIRYGNITGKAKFFNFASLMYLKLHLNVNNLITAVANTKDKPKDIFLLPHDPLMEEQRYTEDHKKITKKNFSAFYLTIKEKGINTAYLIDFYNAQKDRDSRSLYYAVKYISTNEQVDIILFVGTLGMKQQVLIKIPEAKEPRNLNFCLELLDKTLNKNEISQMRSWNFGLYNFDVR